MNSKLIIFLFIIHFSASSQINVYQDIFKGGVTGDAFDSWNLPFGGNFEIHIEPNSTIRRAFLFVTVYFQPDEQILYFNNNPLILNETNSLNNQYSLINGTTVLNMKTLMLDVTNLIHPSQTTYVVSALNQPTSIIDGIYCEYYLYVTYENPTMQIVCANTYINNVQPNANMLYFLDNLNPLNLSQNVGFALNSSHMCDTIEDGSYVKINSIDIGLIGGQDDGGGSSCSGVTGTFFYQNGILSGLGNDVGNSTMSGTDAIANIETYLNSTTSFDLEFEYQSNLGPKTNPINQLFLTYTTPCQPFDVTVPNDTTVCYGSQVQLNATGGSSTGSLPAYEWSPATGLSCTTCPNPIFTADSSMFYTVRIRNNDSCSVVRPVKINVRPLPSINAISTVATECGSSTGSLTASSSGSIGSPFAMQDLFVVTENGDTLSATSQNQLNATVSNLGAGNYTVFYTDQNGCVSLDTVVTISSINNTIADFTVTPTSGGAPLTVNVNNASQNATDFEWFTSTGLSHQGTVPPAYVFDSSGTYQIMLVAWQHDPACADTAYMNVVVFDSLVVQIPNVFSPNGDGINDFFSITVNQDVKAQIQIVNRWGNNLFSFDGLLKSGVNDLWDGADVSDGVYFYKLTVDMKTVDMLTGYNGQLKKEGFVTIVGK